MTDLPQSAARVQEAADRLGLPIEVRTMPASTRTAEDAAAACGTTVGQIVKSLVFRGRQSGAAYLLLVAGTNRVDEAAVAARIGEPLERADAAFVRATTGFAIGGIPPFGHASPMRTFMDEDLLAHADIWAAAGTPSAVFRTTPHALREATGPQVIRMGR